MHELGITRNIVSIVAERAAGRQVTKVVVEIGKLSAIMPDAVAFCFDVCAKGTPLEGAKSLRSWLMQAAGTVANSSTWRPCWNLARNADPNPWIERGATI